MKSERDKIAAKARKMVTDPAVAAEWRAAWVRVYMRMEDIWAASRPPMKSFEAHHMTETAREVMLRALVAGKPMDECEEIAFRSVTP